MQGHGHRCGKCCLSGNSAHVLTHIVFTCTLCLPFISLQSYMKCFTVTTCCSLKIVHEAPGTKWHPSDSLQGEGNWLKLWEKLMGLLMSVSVLDHLCSLMGWGIFEGSNPLWRASQFEVCRFGKLNRWGLGHRNKSRISWWMEKEEKFSSFFTQIHQDNQLC